MKIKHPKIPFALIASALAVMALVVSQLIWMRYSHHLSEQIFSQQVGMALCSAIENYDNGALCRKACATKTPSIKVAHQSNFDLPQDFIQRSDFRSTLTKALHFYHIDLAYELRLSKEPSQHANIYQSLITLPAPHGQEAYLHVVFPHKESFILKDMGFMTVASLIILAFITAILWMVNWSLIKKKQLLQTNIDFFNNMAHEFRTPLSSIGLAANMLGKKHEELSESPLLEVIRRENNHLLNEVERVLHLASVENGKNALQKEQIVVKSLLQSAMNSLTMSIAEKQAKVTLSEIPEVTISGDRQHLVGVFRNIIDNALKYSIAKPTVGISAKLYSQGILISVQDNGIGIPKEQNELIFAKFQRINSQTHLAQKGFGLGLAYVKSVIELHKGYVQVSSEENKGSRFDVFLPVVVL
jgi:two-component system phosphate regulon sensor histidine kinase PhoR